MVLLHPSEMTGLIEGAKVIFGEREATEESGTGIWSEDRQPRGEKADLWEGEGGKGGLTEVDGKQAEGADLCVGELEERVNGLDLGHRSQEAEDIRRDGLGVTDAMELECEDAGELRSGEFAPREGEIEIRAVLEES